MQFQIQTSFVLCNTKMQFPLSWCNTTMQFFCPVVIYNTSVSASSNLSPPSRRRLHRQVGATTPSTSSSRNESPRFTKECSSDNQYGVGLKSSDNQYGVVKMKKSSARLNPNRNSSTSMTTSTLQEDLIKLIGQDFEQVGMTLNNAKSKVNNWYKVRNVW